MTQIYRAYMDLITSPGVDMDFHLQIIPIQIGMTGVAVMVIDGMPGSPFNVTTSESQVGVIPYMQLDLTIPGAVTQFWTPTTYDYRVFLTFNDGTITEAVNGILLVKNEAMGFPRAPTNSLQYVPPLTGNGSIAGGTSQFFNTYNLPSTLLITAPSPSVDGTIFQTGDAGGYVDTNPAQLSDVNGYLFENPLNGALVSILTWGPGSGGTIQNPNLQTYSIYTWQRVTVTVAGGPVTYWKNIT